MKKIIYAVLTLTIAISTMAGCQKTTKTASEAAENQTAISSPLPTVTENMTGNNTAAKTDATPTASAATPVPSKKPAEPMPKPTATSKPTPVNTSKPSPAPSPKPTPVSSKEITGTLSELIDKIYANIDEKERPGTMKTEINKDSVQYFLGAADIPYTEGMGSEPMISAIAHSLVLIRVPEGTDVKSVMDKIKNSVDPRKWICTGVDPENVRTANIGNLLMLIMDRNSAKYIDSFYKLKN